MKSIKYIFISFFQQHFFGTLNVLLAILFFIVAVVRLVTKDLSDPQEIYIIWILFYLALLALVFILSLHLKRMVLSNSTAMLPDYRKKLLYTSISFAAVFFTTPLIFTISEPFPLPVTFSLFIFSTGLILYLNYKFGENIINILAFIWLLRLVYELFGLPVENRILSMLISINNLPSQLYFSLLLTMIGSLLIYLFVKTYLATTVTEAEDSAAISSDPWAKDYDKDNSFTQKRLKKILTKEKAYKWKSSLWGQIRRLQYSLFSPGTVHFGYGIKIGFVLIYLFSFIYIMYGQQSFEQRDFIPIYTLVFYISAMFISTDFLQHRDRLSLLWMTSVENTRSKFVQKIILTFLYVIIKQYLLVAILFSFVYFLFISNSLAQIMIGILTGLILNLILPGIALLSSRLIESPVAKGWALSNLFAMIVMLTIAVKTWQSINISIIFIGLLLSIILYVLAFMKWRRYDMDYKGPQLYV